MRKWIELLPATLNGLRRGAVLSAILSAMLAGPVAMAQGLSYQKATDDPLGGNPNIFPSTAYTSGANNTDGLWGLRSFGTQGPFGVGEVWEAGIGEDVPELRQNVRNLTPNTSYDLYAAYWTDDDENWTIRSGVTSEDLTLYSFNGDHRSQPVAESTIGLAAGAAIWSSLPPPTNAGTPFTQARPGAANPEPFDDPLVMLLGYAGQAMSNAAGEIDVFVDDLPLGGGVNRTWFDGVAYLPATGPQTPIALNASINRDTGALTVNNPTAQAFQVKSYFVDSVGGGIDAAQWTTINSTNPAWTVTATPDPSAPYATSFAEDGAGNTVAIAASGGSLDFGNVWNKSPIEDFRVYLTLADDTLAVLSPEYTGTEAIFGDLNGNDSVDLTDFQTLLDGMHTSLVGLELTAVERYQRGDLTGESVINYNDFAAFRTAYEDFNGAGSFAVAQAQVPEPSSLALLLGVGALALGYIRRRSAKLCAAGMMCSLLAGMSGTASAIDIAVDIDVSTATIPIATQSGFTSWDLTEVGTEGSTIAVDGVTFEIFDLNGANQSRVRGTGGGGPFNDLLADFIFNEGAEARAIGLRISDLPVGTYHMRSWHFDSAIGGANATQVEIRDQGGSAQTVVSNVPFSQAPISFILEVASPTPAKEILFRESSATNRARLNGFVIEDFTGLTLEVTTNTGAMRFLNEQGSAVDMSYYEISSSTGQLAEGSWTSLDSTEGGDPLGTGWDEITNPNANILSEVNLQSISSFAPSGMSGDSFSLGNAFTPNGTQDLRFLYEDPAEEFLRAGLIKYVTGPGGLAGDYNGDGTVNAADYTVWRDNLGGSGLPNDDTPGTVDQNDYDVWVANFGSGAGSGSGSTAAIPEPTSLGLLGMAAMLLGVGYRRQR